MKLPVFVSVKIVFNEDTIQYTPIIGLCPYFSYGCSKLRILIVEGAHLQLQAMQFTKDNGDETQRQFEGFAYVFPQKSTIKEITKQIGLGLHQG